MKSLTKKFWRQVRQAKWQFMALVAMIALGSFFYGGLTAISHSLDKYIAPYYQTYQLSDVLVYFDNLPPHAVSSFAQIAGVKRAEARQVSEQRLDWPDATLLVHTIPQNNQINRSAVIAGRVSGKGEVMIDSYFARANHLQVGDNLAFGERSLVISGLCENVEHGFNIADSGLVLPDRTSYGVAYLSEQSLEQPAYNQLMIQLAEGVEVSDVLPRIEAVAADYAYQYSLPQAGLPSVRAIQATMDNNRVLSRVIPVILFAISAVVLFLTLSRLVESERSQIGIMKALGTSRMVIGFRFMLYPLTCALLGTVIGFGLADVFFVPLLDDIGRRTYSLPGFAVSLNWFSIGVPLAGALLFGGLACYFSIRRILARPAIELMKPQTFKTTRRVGLEKYPRLWQRLSFSSRLMLRHVSLHKFKLIAGAVGLMVCLILLVTALGFQVSLRLMMQRTREMNRYDYFVSADNQPIESLLADQAVEWSPVTQLALQLNDAAKTRWELLVLDGASAHFQHFDADHQPLQLTDEGIIFPQAVAHSLGIVPGQTIAADLSHPDGTTQKLSLRVAQLSAQYTAPKLFASDKYIAGLISDLRINAASVRLRQTDPAAFEAELNRQSKQLSIENKAGLEQRINNLMHQNNPVFVIFILVAMILSLGAIYTVSTIRLQERKQEMAILKVLGYSGRQIYHLLVRENYLMSLIAIVLAWPFCRLSYGQLVRALQSSGQMIPDNLDGWTLLAGSGLMIFFCLLSNQFLKPAIRRIDMAESIKQFE